MGVLLGFFLFLNRAGCLEEAGVGNFPLPPGRFSQVSKALIKLQEGDFSGGPLVNTLDFHCRELRFTPWLGN